MKYLIVDDLKFNYRKTAPLRSQVDIRAGVLKLRQKIEGYLAIDEVHLVLDKRLQEIYKERYSSKIINHIPEGKVCFINSRVVIDEKVAEIIAQQPCPSYYTTANNEFVSLKIDNEVSQNMDCNEFFQSDWFSMPSQVCQVKLWESLQEIILTNAQNIRQDYNDFFYDKDNFSETEQGVTIINPYHVWIGEGTSIKQGTVLDASTGPIIIDENVLIGINCVIEGPAYIGKNSRLQTSTNLREGSTVGNDCIVGGEIVNSIFQAYSNSPFRNIFHKCYIGEWTKVEAGVILDSDFFAENQVTIIRDYSLTFLFNNGSNDNICQFQEMRKDKLEAMKIDKNSSLSKLEQRLIEEYLIEDY